MIRAVGGGGGGGSRFSTWTGDILIRLMWTFHVIVIDDRRNVAGDIFNINIYIILGSYYNY